MLGFDHFCGFKQSESIDGSVGHSGAGEYQNGRWCLPSGTTAQKMHQIYSLA